MPAALSVRCPDIECEGCANAIKRSLGSVGGVQNVEVGIEDKKVTVRYDEETARSGKLSGGEDAHPCAPRAEGHLALRQNVEFLLFVTAVNDADINLEPRFDFASCVTDPLDPVIPNEHDIGAFQCGDHSGGEADDASRTENGDLQSF